MDDDVATVSVFDLQLEDCALQLYKHNGTQYEYSSYLDLETTLAEQSEELDGFSDKYACYRTYSFTLLCNLHLILLGMSSCLVWYLVMPTFILLFVLYCIIILFIIIYFFFDQLFFFICSKKNSILLRTQLSVRVHACIGKFIIVLNFEIIV